MLISPRLAQVAAQAVQDRFGLDVLVTDERGLPIGAASEPGMPSPHPDVAAYLSGSGATGRLIPLRRGGDTAGFALCSREPDAPTAAAIGLLFDALLDYTGETDETSRAAQAEAALVTRLCLQDPNAFDTDIETDAAQLGYRIAHPMAVIAVRLSPRYNYCLNVNLGYESAANQAKREIAGLLRHHMYLNKQDIFAFIKDNYFVLIKAIEEINDLPRLYAMLYKIQTLLDEIFSQFHIFNYQLSAGRIVESYTQAHLSFKEAVKNIGLGMLLALEGTVVTAEDVLLPAIVAELPSVLLIKSVQPGVDALCRENPESTHGILQCFEYFTNCGLNVATTAKDLFLHRNTVNKRLQKLKRLTGFDPFGSFFDILMIKFIAQQYLLLRQSAGEPEMPRE